jgi:hypothetical protein
MQNCPDRLFIKDLNKLSIGTDLNRKFLKKRFLEIGNDSEFGSIIAVLHHSPSGVRNLGELHFSDHDLKRFHSKSQTEMIQPAI